MSSPDDHLYQCQLCFKEPPGEVYVCRYDGQLFCSMCYFGMHALTCQTCQTRRSPLRNLAMESLIAKRDEVCPNCSEVTRKADRHMHVCMISKCKRKSEALSDGSVIYYLDTEQPCLKRRSWPNKRSPFTNKTLLYEGDCLREDQEDGGRRSFYDGPEGEERLVRKDAFGIIAFYEGNKGFEHMVMEETADGTKYFYEGAKGSEYQVRVESGIVPEM